jgi:signal transduction histidine kinase/DNA-binding response OmpR family regulator
MQRACIWDGRSRTPLKSFRKTAIPRRSFDRRLTGVGLIWHDATENGAPSPKSADFHFLIERNADGIIVVDEDGVVQFANPSAEQAFGRPSNDLCGAPIGMPLVAGETTEISILRPGGSQIDAEMRVVETTWRDNPALLVSLRDVSARKATEEQLRETQKMEAIGRLTAGIAHDFNNLLTVVMGNLATIQREISVKEIGDKIVRAAEHALEGTKRAATLTQQLLAFARRQPLEPQPVDVGALVSRMTELLGRTLDERIKVCADVRNDPLFALADPNQLEAAILNLAVNASDAMPDGGDLSIEAGLKTIEAGASSLVPGDYVELRVRDSGVGMPPEVAARAFEPFFTTKEPGRGTGLGLSQVFGFVKQSGGDVRIESQPGKGTEVVLVVPWASPVDTSATDDCETSTEAPMRTETVLVVDDEPDVRNYSVATLKELGYKVLEAGDADAALELLACHDDINLLFTDVRLPSRLNGRELGDEARRMRPGLKVLLTTGYASEILMRDGRLEPGLQLLPKPFTDRALAAKVRLVLDANQASRRVLVVEDEVLVRMVIVQDLTDAGYEVEEAGSIKEAQTRLRQLDGKIDVAILDIGLPDGRGDQLAEEIRASQPDLPILLATGYENATTRAKLDGDPRVCVIGKPFDGQRLLAALRKLG